MNQAPIDQLIEIRLAQAKESLEEARTLKKWDYCGVQLIDLITPCSMRFWLWQSCARRQPRNIAG